MRERTDFRGDIQGIRAVAVLLVIVAHAGFGRFAGGFVGVDVFFVVSGFLIIGLLVREAEGTGRISVLGFYARRARRILPAATVVLVATTALAVYVLPLVRAQEVVKDAVWAGFFASNVRFAAVETDYFAADDPPSPFQHFWSLSVEEQFYVVIPLLLAGAALLARRRRSGGVRTRDLAVPVLVLTVASLVWSVLHTADNPTAAYFSTPARAWELGVGGLVAILVRGWGGTPSPIRPWQAATLGWVGLAMVGFATLTFDAGTPFPGTAAAVPVLGTALVLAAGSTAAGQGSLLSRLLSWRPMLLVGAWSYSLYLWHWPVIQLAHEHWGRRLSLSQVLVALVVTFALSAATFYLVEEPFRRGVRWRPPRRAVLLYPLSLVLVGGTAWGGQTYVDDRFADLADNPGVEVSDFARAELSDDPAVAIVEASVLAAEDGRPVPGSLAPALGAARTSIAPLGDCDYREGMRRLCPTGTPDSDRSIVVVGDSHARAWGPTFTRIGETAGYAVYHLVYAGCPANRDSRPEPGTGAQWTACEDFQEWTREQVAALDPELVVVANSAYSARALPDELDGLAWEIEQLRESAGRVVLLGDLPTLPRVPGVCLSERDADLGSCLFTPSPGTHRDQLEFGRVATGAGAEFLNARRWFCADGKCPAVIGHYVPMRDKDHITVEYAEALAEPVGRALRLLEDAGS
ncbi:acyltransferase family protein [Nocardioides dongkuii]|uniref:acyltransferase family protein n=1 Tax=Nocardioides dongkuii TaxID=2760089 RepID=UPI0015FE11A6|nr:acyltransferase family protein [Nocardioides dongkuii]